MTVVWKKAQIALGPAQSEPNGANARQVTPNVRSNVYGNFTLRAAARYQIPPDHVRVTVDAPCEPALLTVVNSCF